MRWDSADDLAPDVLVEPGGLAPLGDGLLRLEQQARPPPAFPRRAAAPPGRRRWGPGPTGISLLGEIAGEQRHPQRVLPDPPEASADAFVAGGEGLVDRILHQDRPSAPRSPCGRWRPPGWWPGSARERRRCWPVLSTREDSTGSLPIASPTLLKVWRGSRMTFRHWTAMAGMVGTTSRSFCRRASMICRSLSATAADALQVRVFTPPAPAG